MQAATNAMLKEPQALEHLKRIGSSYLQHGKIEAEDGVLTTRSEFSIIAYCTTAA